MKSALELRINRKQTEHFIQENPTAISLERTTKTPNGKGGFTTSKGLISAQTFRMILASQGNVASRNVDGEEVKPDFVLIGLWDANVDDDDTFMFEGRNYEVMYLRGAGAPTEYETWVEVKYVG